MNTWCFELPYTWDPCVVISIILIWYLPFTLKVRLIIDFWITGFVLAFLLFSFRNNKYPVISSVTFYFVPIPTYPSLDDHLWTLWERSVWWAVYSTVFISFMMASAKKKLDEKNLKLLRELASQPHNKKCFDCGQRGPTYVNMTIGSFVCTSCSGIL